MQEWSCRTEGAGARDADLEVPKLKIQTVADFIDHVRELKPALKWASSEVKGCMAHSLL
jgi:hypothetical protein